MRRNDKHKRFHKSDYEIVKTSMSGMFEFQITSGRNNHTFFKGKIIMGNEVCRTTSVNEVVNVLTRNCKAFESLKNEKAVFWGSFFAMVPEGIKLSNFLEGLESLNMLMGYV